MTTFNDLLTFTRNSPAWAYDRFGDLSEHAIDVHRLQHDPSSVTTSSTTIDFDDLVKGDSVLIDLPGSDTFAVGQDISVTDSSDIDRYLTAKVEFSNPGSVQATVKTINGTGTGSSWTLIRNLGLLIEEQRTNVFLQSEATVSDNRWATRSGSSLSDSTILGRNAIRNTILDQSAEAGRLWTLVNGAAGNHNNRCWRQMLVRVSDPSLLNVHIRIAGNSSNTYFAGDARYHIIVDLEIGEVTYAGQRLDDGAHTVEDLGSGVFLIKLEQNYSSDVSLAAAGWIVAAARKGGDERFDQPAQNGDWIEFTACQREELAGFPTSYIKTEGAQVTRETDNCSRTLGAEFNANQGTITATAKARTGDIVARLGSVEIVADTDEEKTYTVSYESDPEATDLEIMPGANGYIKELEYETR